MFVDNKYTRYYYRIIKGAQDREPLLGYFEEHHIIPESLGGLTVATNLVLLSAREHFVCHLLLTRMTAGNNKSKMCYAARLMSNTRRLSVSSKMYAQLKEGMIPSMLGKNHTSDTKNKIREANLGKVVTIETREKMRSRMVGNKIRVGLKHKTDTIAKMIGNTNGTGNKGRQQSPEHKAKRSAAMKAYHALRSA
jgi:hypothetical protein